MIGTYFDERMITINKDKYYELKYKGGKVYLKPLTSKKSKCKCQCKCLKKLKKRIRNLKKQNKQQALEILRLNKVVERHTDRINRLNQRLHNVERILNVP
ncbi:hypothetical protein FDZ14_00315 (plasmid) [Priestia megaterium]|uniref:Uncharacterized protein n=1 Tax=Priestia megaterium TaxID=1404 RepID=A0A6M6DTU0_PRIMG|nr:hypothetical protein FDZ14_00315 [Priestia megaterium]